MDGLVEANGIQGVAVDDRSGGVRAATSGGVVYWNREASAYRKYTPADGLTSNVVDAVAVNANSGEEWFGTSAGVIHLGVDEPWQTLSRFRAPVVGATTLGPISCRAVASSVDV